MSEGWRVEVGGGEWRGGGGRRDGGSGAVEGGSGGGDVCPGKGVRFCWVRVGARGWGGRDAGKSRG